MDELLETSALERRGVQPKRRRLALETYRNIPSVVATVLRSAEPAVKDW